MKNNRKNYIYFKCTNQNTTYKRKISPDAIFVQGDFLYCHKCGEMHEYPKSTEGVTLM